MYVNLFREVTELLEPTFKVYFEFEKWTDYGYMLLKNRDMYRVSYFIIFDKNTKEYIAFHLVTNIKSKTVIARVISISKDIKIFLRGLSIYFRRSISNFKNIDNPDIFPPMSNEIYALNPVAVNPFEEKNFTIDEIKKMVKNNTFSSEIDNFARKEFMKYF
jgi:hypothetical protein